MSERVCPHCGQIVRDEYALCPYCGTNVETGERPTPDPKDKIAAGSGGLLGACVILASYFFFGATGIVARNMAGFTKSSPEERAYWLFWATHGFWLMHAVPLAVTGLLYLLLRRRFPAFARGVGQSFLVALVIALGAPFICRQ